MARLSLAALAAALLLLVAACESGDRDATASNDVERNPASEEDPEQPGDEGADENVGEDPAPEDASDGGDESGETADDADELPDPAEIGANELGLVPIIMYHRLLEDGGGDYDLTPEQFRAELVRLHEEGYRPVRLRDVVRGEIDVPAGTTPVVLTFDDSTREQIAFGEDGGISTDTAIGILLDFAEAHEGFEATASVYINAYPFGGGSDSDALVAALHELGFELGNHSAGHTRLDRLSDDEVRRELAQGKENVTRVVPDAEVVTLSLPLGIWSDPRELAYAGSWQGTSYEHEGILLVGAEPAPSPFHVDFDPMAIPRIRSGPWDGGDPDYASGFWLDWLAANPERRYVSDGDPDRVSFPSSLAEEASPRLGRRAYQY